MKLENQVCSLEQAKKLKELGITRVGGKSETGFYYWIGGEPKDQLYYEDAWPDIESSTAAFTLSELGLMLPDFIETENVCFKLSIWKNTAYWFVSYWWDEDTRKKSGLLIKTARGDYQVLPYADMLIYLLENNLITPEECNKRLLAA